MFNDYTQRAHNDSRFKVDRHFMLSDVNAEFLKKHNIKMTVTEFKKFLTPARRDFVAHAGNSKKAPFKSVNVFDITEIKSQLNSQVRFGG